MNITWKFGAFASIIGIGLIGCAVDTGEPEIGTEESAQVVATTPTSGGKCGAKGPTITIINGTYSSDGRGGWKCCTSNESSCVYCGTDNGRCTSKRPAAPAPAPGPTVFN